MAKHFYSKPKRVTFNDKSYLIKGYSDYTNSPNGKKAIADYHAKTEKKDYGWKECINEQILIDLAKKYC